MNKNSFNSDYVIHPGEILTEELEARNLSVADFAESCGLPVQTVYQIMIGEGRITPFIANRFQRVLKVPSHIWINLNREYYKRK